MVDVNVDIRLLDLPEVNEHMQNLKDEIAAPEATISQLINTIIGKLSSLDERLKAIEQKGALVQEEPPF
jgi:hypothetical protein